VTTPDDALTPGPDEEPGDGGSGLPPELERVLRGLTGGAPIDPRLAEMVQSMGLGDVDPQMVAAVAQQVQAMLAAPEEDGPIALALATDIARKAVAAQGDTLASARDRSQAAEAVDVAGLWLDPVTDLSAPALHGVAWSAAEWVEATMPVWAELVEPVAAGVGTAIGTAMRSQLARLGDEEVDWTALGVPEGLVPPGVNPAQMMGQLEPMMRRMSSSMFSLQVGQGVGALAGEVLTGCEVSLPIVPQPTVALLPSAVAAFAEGLEIDLAQVRLYLAVREVARARLFAAVPWLGPQLLAAVRDYARDISIDTDSIEQALGSVDPTDIERVQEALQDRLFHPEPSRAQQAALARLETLLALVEGWVDVVTVRASTPHLPQVEALGEAVRRRRASGGPAERTFEGLVGLQLRPRRLRDAANLFSALEAEGGPAARDAAWAHPDVAPGPGDLDDPLGYVERSRSGGDPMDAELAALLDEPPHGAPGAGGAGPA